MAFFSDKSSEKKKIVKNFFSKKNPFYSKHKEKLKEKFFSFLFNLILYNNNNNIKGCLYRLY